MARGERNREQGADNQQTTATNNQHTIVLKVYLHCQECAKPVVKCLKDFEGVLEANADLKNHTVTVTAKKDVDPKKLAERLQKKRNKLVEIISPKLKEGKSSQPKTPQPKITKVILSIYIHCENCGKSIMQNIQKMAGVQSVEMNVKGLRATVVGLFEPPKLLEYVNKRMGKQATIVKTETVNGASQQQQQQQQQQQRSNENRRNTNTQGDQVPLDGQSPQELQFLYEILSDENSNACVIM